MADEPSSKLPDHHYKAVDRTSQENWVDLIAQSLPKLLKGGEHELFLGDYQRKVVTNLDVDETGRRFFDLGLRLMMSYQHELAAQVFIASLTYSPDCALTHGLVALCHSPNYNFKGVAYYQSTHRPEEITKGDLLCIFPSQQVADRHSKLAMDKIDELKRRHRKKKPKGKGKKKAPRNDQTTEAQLDASVPMQISNVEVQWLAAIRILTSSPGLAPDLSHSVVGRPYADAMRKVYQANSSDAEVAYAFCESLMVLNAWQLYEYPSGKPLSPDVEETRRVLEHSLYLHPDHAGLCHMFVHLSEMSPHPEKALRACRSLRSNFPHAGHLVHMVTHIDVLLGDYAACVRDNKAALEADTYIRHCSPSTAGPTTFYFGYIVHDYHMAVYGAILGGMEQEGRRLAAEVDEMVNEVLFEEYPELTSYLESYSALDVHVLVRFGRWAEILQLPLPKSPSLMLYRACSLRFARGLALANQGNAEAALVEANILDSLRGNPETKERILHNNSIARLLQVDAVMLRGEMAYRRGEVTTGLDLIGKAVQLQDDLNYDEPWGKMQPIRHALGGLLLEQGEIAQAVEVFRVDLKYHPKNPWALVGLIACLEQGGDDDKELVDLRELLEACRSISDFDIQVACECCQRKA